VNAIGASEKEARHSGSLGSMPLVVVSRDPEKGADPGLIPPELSRQSEEQWTKMQKELLRLSTNSSQVVAIGSTQYVQIDRGDVVIASVQKVLNAARANSK
jgi:predicted component of type VI protein secretion system